MLTDTHAHLVDDRLMVQLPAVLDRARAAGVTRIVCVATTAADSATCREIARNHPDVVAPTAGVHPNHAVEAQPGDWDRVVALADDPAVVALGETGLDRHWDFTPFAMQQEWFARHLALGRSRGLPVVIHCREAEADVVGMLRDEFDRHGPIDGVMHSFCGSWETAEACLAMGLHVSFAGMLTYKSADDVRAVAARVPADRLLVETDCPYLAPVPHRGKTNEPALVAVTAGALAGLREIDLNSLASITSENARRLFFPKS